jgi:hypothetical protein
MFGRNHVGDRDTCLLLASRTARLSKLRPTTKRTWQTAENNRIVSTQIRNLCVLASLREILLRVLACAFLRILSRYGSLANVDKNRPSLPETMR